MQQRLLNDRQFAIAQELQALLAPHSVEDSFMAMLSLMAGTINFALDNGPASRALAAEMAQRLVDTVDAGQSGKIAMSRPEGRMQ